MFAVLCQHVPVGSRSSERDIKSINVELQRIENDVRNTFAFHYQSQCFCDPFEGQRSCDLSCPSASLSCRVHAFLLETHADFVAAALHLNVRVREGTAPERPQPVELVKEHFV